MFPVSSLSSPRGPNLSHAAQSLLLWYPLRLVFPFFLSLTSLLLINFYWNLSRLCSITSAPWLLSNHSWNTDHCLDIVLSVNLHENSPSTTFFFYYIMVLQFSSVTQSCPTLCDPMNRSTPGLPVHHHLREFTQTHVQYNWPSTLVGSTCEDSNICTWKIFEKKFQKVLKNRTWICCIWASICITFALYLH